MKNTHIISAFLSCFCLALLVATANTTLAASFSLSPASGEFKNGCTSSVRVIINTQGAASNAADIVLASDNIKIESIRGGNAYTNYAGGGSRLTGFSIGTELNGSASFATITFKNIGNAKSGTISIISGGSTNSVIANTDGQNILSGASGGSYTFVDGECVVPAKPTPPAPVEVKEVPKCEEPPVPACPGEPIMHGVSEETGLPLPRIEINDPVDGASVKSLSIRGTTDPSSESVTLVLYQANYPIIESIAHALDAFDTTTPESAQQSIDELQRSIIKGNEFIQTYGEGTESLRNIIAALQTELDTLKKSLDAFNANTSKRKKWKPAIDTRSMSSQLRGMQTGAKNLGITNEFIDSDDGKKLFVMNTIPDIGNGIYDIAARATLANGTTIASNPVQVSVMSGLSTTEAKIVSIGSIELDQVPEDSVINTTDARAKLSGEVEGGTEIFALWDDGKYISYDFVDQNAKSFEISAPKDLSIGKHFVTIYTITHKDGKLIRSDDHTTVFEISAPDYALYYTILGLGLLLLLVLEILRRIFRKHKRKFYKNDVKMRKKP